MEFKKVLPRIEEQLAPFDARPHWAKAVYDVTGAPAIVCMKKLPDFRQLLQHYDPQGKFRNAFLDKYIWGQLGFFIQ